jgi:hypothetical protein
MPDFRKLVAATRDQIDDAESKAFSARWKTMSAILEGADPDDVMLLCAIALVDVAPLCCSKHLQEFRGDFLARFDDCAARAIANEQQDAAEEDAAPPQLH